LPGKRALMSYVSKAVANEVKCEMGCDGKVGFVAYCREKAESRNLLAGGTASRGASLQGFGRVG